MTRANHSVDMSVLQAQTHNREGHVQCLSVGPHVLHECGEFPHSLVKGIGPLPRSQPRRCRPPMGPLLHHPGLSRLDAVKPVEDSWMFERASDCRRQVCTRRIPRTTLVLVEFESQACQGILPLAQGSCGLHHQRKIGVGVVPCSAMVCSGPARNCAEKITLEDGLACGVRVRLVPSFVCMMAPGRRCQTDLSEYTDTARNSSLAGKPVAAPTAKQRFPDVTPRDETQRVRSMISIIQALERLL